MIKKASIVFIVITLFFLSVLFSNPDIKLFFLLLSFTLIFLIVFLKSFKMPTLIILLLFVSTPILSLWLYFIFNKRTTRFHQFWQFDNIIFSVILTTLFIIAYYFIFKLLKFDKIITKIKENRKNFVVKFKKVKNGHIVIYLFFLLFILFTILGNRGETIFTTVYSELSRASFLGVNIFREFCIVFLPLIVIFSKSLLKAKRLCLILLFFGIIYNASFGSRIVPLQLLFTYVLLFKISWLNTKKIFIFLIIIIFAVAFIGILRNQKLDSISRVFNRFIINSDEHVSLHTAGGIYHSYLTAIDLKKSGNLEGNFGEHYLGTFTRIFLPTNIAIKIFGNIAKPPSWRLMDKAYIGGGSYFLGTTYMNFNKNLWFIIVPLFSLVYSYFFIKFQVYLFIGKNNIFSLIALIWASTLPRSIWYGDISSFKISFWGVLLYIIVLFIIKIISGRK